MRAAVYNPEQATYYSLCLACCAIAQADGKIEKQEKELLLRIINSELVLTHTNLRFSGILFDILEKQEQGSYRFNFKAAMTDLKSKKDVINKEEAEKYARILETVAKAFPPVSEEEQALINEFRQGMLEGSNA